MSRVFLHCLFLAAICTSVQSETVHFKFEPIRLNVGPKFTIQLPVVAGAWRLGVAGVSLTKGVPTAFVAMESPACPTCSPERQPLKAFQSVAANTTSEGLRVLPAPGATGAIMVLVTLPVGTVVEVTEGARVVCSTLSKEGGEVYRDGAPTQESFSNVPSFLTQAYAYPGAAASSPIMSASGVLIAGPQEFRKYLVAMNLPSFPPPPFVQAVGVMIELDTQGTVVRADTVGKPDQYSLALCTEMRKWRFRPVLFQGKAVRAKAVLTAVFRPDGSIELPGFN